MSSLSRPTLTRNQTEAPLTRSQTNVVDVSDDVSDDEREECPELVSIPPSPYHFDGSKSTSTAETLVDFLKGFNWNTTQLKDIPGIGPASIGKLHQCNIKQVQQLVGQYMGFVELNATSADINNKFYEWFKTLSPNANAHTVTFAIAHVADRFGIVLYED